MFRDFTNETIQTFLAAIDAYIRGVFGEVWAYAFGWLTPLVEWYFYAAIAFAIICVIGFFLPFKWVRAILGGIVLLGGMFLAGGHFMYRTLQQKKSGGKGR